MAKLSVTLARNIRCFRELRKWSRADLAKRMNVHPNSIVRYESGDVGITVQMAERFAAVFSVEETDLFYPGSAPLEHSVEECARRVYEDVKKRVDPRESETFVLLSQEDLSTPAPKPKNKRQRH